MYTTSKWFAKRSTHVGYYTSPAHEMWRSSGEIYEMEGYKDTRIWKHKGQTCSNSPNWILDINCCGLPPSFLSYC